MASRPDKVPTWATSGAIVDPGAAKQAAGWLTNEHPPAQYFNWLQNNTGAWLEYWKEQFALQSVADTLTFVDGSHVTLANLVEGRFFYSTSDEKWLALFKASGTATVYLSESTDDGVTWASPFSTGVTADYITRIVNKGSNYYFIADQNVWKSTSFDYDTFADTTINLSGGNFTRRGLCYDPTNDIFVTTAYTGADGVIQSASDPEGTWTTRHTLTGLQAADTAVDGSGNFVVVGEDGEVRTSTDGISWTDRGNFGAATGSWTTIEYFAQDDVFVAFQEDPTLSNRALFCSYDKGVSWEGPFIRNVNGWAVTPYGVIVMTQSAATTSAKDIVQVRFQKPSSAMTSGVFRMRKLSDAEYLGVTNGQLNLWPRRDVVSAANTTCVLFGNSGYAVEGILRGVY